MIVCDVCKEKRVAAEVEIEFKPAFLSDGLPIKMHLCNQHQSQFVEAVRLVASIFRSVEEQPNDTRCKDFIARMIPWKFNEKGQRA